MSQNESKFDIWWNSPSVKRLVGVVYSLGASVVIVGAMFKILHLPGAAAVLGTGMTVEAVLFALGIFDKPHKEYEWHKIFDFEGNEIPNPDKPQKSAVAASTGVGLNYSEKLNDDDVKKLSEGIKNLSTTAGQLSSLTNVVTATDTFVKSIDSASKATGSFIQSQETLNGASNKLANSYLGVSADMDEVVKNTKLYSGKVEDVTKNLSSINSIYEIQLKNIQAQTEGLTSQGEQVRLLGKQLEAVASETEKIKAATTAAATETDKYKEGTLKLSKQIADLNQVYGNMLNALS
ncbi:MAG: gliding motility protein GldL [Paludibacter sp.]